MYDILIIGSGNVASALYYIFTKAGFHCAIAARDKEKALQISSHIYEIDNLPKSNIYMIAVKDDAIEEVATQIAKQADRGAIVCHTAGSVSIDQLSDTITNAGVFYPLQTFSKGREEDLVKFTIFVEGRSKESREALKALCNTIGYRCVELDSQSRQKMHIAAVFVSNFTNFMYVAAEDILSACSVSFDEMKPLIGECAAKVVQSNKSAIELQTGPARRGDRKVIDTHTNTIEQPQLKEIYRIISDAIENRYNEKF